MIALVFFLASQCTGAACPNPCRACAFLPVEGDNPGLAEWRELFAAVAQRQEDGGVSVDSLEVGTGRARQDAQFPCRMLPAIGMAESSIREFCDNRLTVISFDCGFGVMQVTSGAASYPGIESSPLVNIAAGADILAAKWNGDQSFGGHFGDSDPQFLESWYFATWAYNGFVYSNNPNNPDDPPNRPPFNSPGSLSRGSYPYQEIPWGYLAFPQEKEGEPVFDPVDVSYPALCNGNVATCCPGGGTCSGIPNQSGLFNTAQPLPQPAHADPCVEVCPPSGCPPREQRELILDDEDPTFTIDGPNEAHAEGGFSDHFFSAAPANPATTTARWEGVAPASGTFDVAGFIPLNPATNEAVPVVVEARGQTQRFSYDQNVNGGIFVSLGQVVLRQGERVVVVVDNNTTDTDPDHRLGLDAFRFRWLGDGEVAEGASCSADTQCLGDALCVDGTCTAGCEVTGCSGGATCDSARGLCVGGEGEGEGEGEEGEGEEGEGEGEGEGVIDLPRSVTSGGCPNCSAGGSPIAALLLLLPLRFWRRRQR